MLWLTGVIGYLSIFLNLDPKCLLKNTSRRPVLERCRLCGRFEVGGGIFNGCISEILLDFQIVLENNIPTKLEFSRTILILEGIYR